VRETTAQLHPGRDTFEFDQGHVTKNQPITELILSSESLAIKQIYLINQERGPYWEVRTKKTEGRYSPSTVPSKLSG